jgi:disulfide oxidoreductase YuzD
MTAELKKVYGDKVEVKYIDVDKVGLANYPIMDQVLQMGYPYPVTLIDGQPKFAGGIMTTEVKELIEETLQGKTN